MATYAPGTGGAQAPGQSAAANTNQGSGQVPQTTKRHKGKKRRVDGVVQYQWPNGTWHSRPFGKKFRHSSGGDGGGTGTSLSPTGQQPGGSFTQPGQQPSHHPLLDRANSLANIRYGPVEQSLNARGQAIPVWYQNYMNDVTADQAASRAYAAPIEQAAQQRAQQAGQTAPGLDPSTPAGQDAALAAAARQAMGDAFVTTLQTVGAAQTNYLAGRKAVAATSELGQQTQLASDRTATAKEKGEYVTSTLGDLRDKKRQQKLENAAFGLKASDAGNKLNKFGYTTQEWNSFSDAKRNRIRNKGPKTQGPDLGSVNKYGYTEKQWRNMAGPKRRKIIETWETQHNDPKGKKPGDGDGPAQFTPAARHKTKADIRKGMGAVKAQIGAPGYSAQAFWARAYSGLVNEKGYDPLLARAIIQRMRVGHVNAKIAKRLKNNYGITLGSGKATTLPVGPSSVPVVGGVIGLGGTG